MSCSTTDFLLNSLQLKGIDGTSLLALIDYMYSGRLTINEQNVQSLLTTGSLLQVNFSI